MREVQLNLVIILKLMKVSDNFLILFRHLLTNVFNFLDATYFPDRAAQIFYRPPLVAGGAHLTFAPVASADLANATGIASTPSKSTASPLDTIKDTLSAALPSLSGSRDVEIGSIGILHPTVLKAYELDYPCSSLEFNIEQFL